MQNSDQRTIADSLSGKHSLLYCRSFTLILPASSMCSFVKIVFQSVGIQPFAFVSTFSFLGKSCFSRLWLHSQLRLSPIEWAVHSSARWCHNRASFISPSLAQYWHRSHAALLWASFFVDPSPVPTFSNPAILKSPFSLQKLLRRLLTLNRRWKFFWLFLSLDNPILESLSVGCTKYINNLNLALGKIGMNNLFHTLN